MYLGSSAMRAMSSSLSLASTVLRFAIVELWCENDKGDGFNCVYVHAAENIVLKYKDIIVGYYPDHRRQHVVSPKLCALSKKAPNKCHWHTSNSDTEILYELSQYPVLTEMCYAVEGKEGHPGVYIVGFAGERIEKRQAKLKFLSGLGLAVSVAVYDFEEDDSSDAEEDDNGDAVMNELDIKKFVPARALIATPMASTNNIPALNMPVVNNISVAEFSLGIWGKNMSDANLAAMHSMQATPRSRAMTFDGGCDIGLDLGGSYSPRIASPHMISPRQPLDLINGGSGGYGSPSRITPRQPATVASSASSQVMASLLEEEDNDNEDDYDSTVFTMLRDRESATSPQDVETDREYNHSRRRRPSINEEKVTVSDNTIFQKDTENDEVCTPNSPSASTIDTRTTVSLPVLDMAKLHTASQSSQSQSQGHSKPPVIMPLLPLPLPQQLPQLQTQQQAQSSNEDISDDPDTARSGVTLPSIGINAANIPPTWDPSTPFSFPVAEITAKHMLPNDLTIDSFTDIKHIADGSNANVFLGRLKGQKIIIKMIKASVQNDAVSVHEFDVEHGLLCRISHPNIIRILGAGLYPRRFVVLEYLGGGTLNTMLSQNQAKPGLASRLFRKPTFTYSNLLLKARDLADAFDYIHRNVQPGACIVHRDLKPDNVGFTTDGVLKLFDFGLATCVRTRTTETQKYDMTGFTGSLRYMAPESALRKAYTEKVDVYSFGILIWQMARDKVPFKGLTKEEFLRQVSAGGERPKLDSSWPSAFSSLLTRCWHSDPLQRPSFAMIIDEIDKLILNEAPNRAVTKATSETPTKPFMRGALIRTFSPAASPAQSSWF